MATKKQKHAAALARREKFMAENKACGLAAQEADRERQKERKEDMAQVYREINARYEAILFPR